MDSNVTLRVLEDVYAVCRLDIKEAIPYWAMKSEWFSITKTEDELSIVSKEINVPKNIISERGWRCIKVEGKLDFELVGILSAISTLMAKNNISIFAISTYDTDYILVKEEKISEGIRIFKESGYRFIEKQ